jgi:DNA sulfur modification protein DndE
MTNYQPMEPPVDHIWLSQTAREQLLKLKRATRIQHWNVLCRWALCKSLAEPTPPSIINILVDSNVEMTWQIFAGNLSDILAITLEQRCHNDGLKTDKETLATQFCLHLHRGIGYLAGDSSIKKLENLIEF